MHSVTKGLILREVPYKDADMMITILTECQGKIAASVRGVRRKSSRMSAAVQSLAYSEFTLYENGGRITVNEAEALELFFNLRADLAKLALASYFADVLDAASDEQIANPELLRLGLNALYALSNNIAPAARIKSAFELKIASLSGYAPALLRCHMCGRDDMREGVFKVRDGVLACPNCGGAGMHVDATVLEAMRFIVREDVKRVFSFALPEAAMDTLAKICESYLKGQFDREFKTLLFYKSVL
ncbi:MAG: DNA repair protein RecO [Clostridia bacterium]